MSVIIGSARIAENGHATGGAAGDQKQSSSPDYKGEVSMQEFYVPSKGWYVLRLKSDDHANKTAKNMETACNNKNIGYDQDGRYGVIKYGVNTKTKTEADCSSLVRECVKEATGKDPGDFSTANEASVLENTGLFGKRVAYTSGMKLYTGDVLVTKTKGHTVIVVKGAARDGSSSDTTKGTHVAKPTLKKGSKGSEVSALQKNLNSIKMHDKNGKKLVVDGDFGANTEYAVKSFQKSKKLEVDGIYGPKSYDEMKKAIK